MTGVLSLRSPWCRQEFPDYSERRAIAARIPAGYTVSVTAKGDRSAFGVEVRGGMMSANHVVRERRYYRPGHPLRDGIEQALWWIEDHDTANYAGVAVAVR